MMYYRQIFRIMKNTGADDFEADSVAHDLEGMERDEIIAFANLCKLHRENKNMLVFTLNCNPPKKTHQSSLRIFKPKGLSHSIIAKDKEGQETQNDLMRLMMPYRPEKPIQSPLKLEIEWVYPYRKSEPKKNRGKLIPCDTRPDCDNLAKSLCDCLTRLGFWVDDSQVYDLHFTKYWGEFPHITVRILDFE